MALSVHVTQAYAVFKNIHVNNERKEEYAYCYGKTVCTCLYLTVENENKTYGRAISKKILQFLFNFSETERLLTRFLLLSILNPSLRFQ